MGGIVPGRRLSRLCPAGVRDHAHVLASTAATIVTAGTMPTLPGYVCVTGRRHAVEPYELAEAAQAEFFLDAMSVAEAWRGRPTP